MTPRGEGDRASPSSPSHTPTTPAARACRRSWMRVAAAVFLLACTGPDLATAQSRTSEGLLFGGELFAVTREVDRLNRAFDPDGSLAILDATLLTWPQEPALRWRAARANVILGYLARSDEAARARYREAEAHAQAILAVESTSLQGHYWLAVAKGRRAFHEGLRTGAPLVRETYLAADAVLALDPDHAGAHHALGTLHVEVMRTPSALLWMGANILRIDAMRYVSWEKAEYHHDRALALEPNSVLHRMRRGEFYMLRGRWDEAMADFSVALALPETTAIDGLMKAEVNSFVARVSRARGEGM